jgi:hypothetical protein
VFRTIAQLNPFSRRAATITHLHQDLQFLWYNYNLRMEFGAWIRADRRRMTANFEMTPEEAAKVVLISA